MSNVTPPGPAAADRLTVKSNDVVPESPSWIDTSLIDSSLAPPMQVESLFCGSFGVTSTKSEALLSVSCPLPPVPPGLRS
jgi:hypothetical protein